MRILYRIRQFGRAFSTHTSLLGLEGAQRRLNPEQWEIFTQLQPSEQGHAVAMYLKLLEQGEIQPDLLVAALLHDIGKLCYRMKPLERAMVILVRAVNLNQSQHWGSLPPAGWESLPGWRKAFIVSEQHPAWGAEMALHAGATPLTETLIREHHHPHGHEANSIENSLLRKLRVVDNES